MNVLKQLLGEQSLDLFLEKHFTKLPFSMPHQAKAYSHFLNWAVVKEVLDAKKSVLRIVQDGKVVRDYVELNFAEAKKHHEMGHTLLLRYAEKSSSALNALALDFARSFHTEVDIQLYCTPEGHNAFGWHYDVEEVFILQTKGSKEYSIRQNTIHPNPLVTSIPKDLEYEREASPFEIKVTLEAGDWLYIPSGWWHIARTKKESMHISVGMMPSSAVDIVKYLAKHLSHNKFWRTRMPVHHNFSNKEEEITFYQDAMRKLGHDIEAQISTPEFISAFLKNKKHE